jgi:hypothetical protein
VASLCCARGSERAAEPSGARRAEDIAVLDGLARAYAKRNEEIERRLVLLLLRHMLAMRVQVDMLLWGMLDAWSAIGPL